MNQKQTEKKQDVHSKPLIFRMLIGAGAGLVLISIFLLSADYVNPEWPKFWMVKPLILTPAVTSFGGALYYYFDQLRSSGPVMNVVATILGLLGYVFFLWIGFVLGLNGTFWN